MSVGGFLVNLIGIMLFTHSHGGHGHSHGGHGHSHGDHGHSHGGHGHSHGHGHKHDHHGCDDHHDHTNANIKGIYLYAYLIYTRASIFVFRRIFAYSRRSDG